MPKIKPSREEIDDRREFLKGNVWELWTKLDRDQEKKIPAPLVQKPYPQDAIIIDLVSPNDFKIGNMPVIEAIRNRKSCRVFSKDPVNLEELSYILWATQGVHEIVGEGLNTKRTVPSGGARHPFETYLCVTLVEGLQPGLYRYLAVEHKLYLLKKESALQMKIESAYLAKAPVVFLWTVIPYRSEWRYSVIAHKIIAQDSGHLCQNLYIACESIGLGVCAYGYYNQKKADEFLGVDGQDEFVIYAARVGKPKH